MRVRGLLLGCVIGCAMAVAAAPARAEVTIVDENAAPVATVEKARCAVKKKQGDKYFVAFAEGTNGWELDVYITGDFWGGVKDDYSLFFGVREVGFDLFSPDGELFSNQFPFPGQPPGAGGAIKFSNDGKRLAIGFYAAPNRDYTRGYAFAGALRCKYKRKFAP